MTYFPFIIGFLFISNGICFSLMFSQKTPWEALPFGQYLVDCLHFFDASVVHLFWFNFCNLFLHEYMWSSCLYAFHALLKRICASPNMESCSSDLTWIRMREWWVQVGLWAVPLLVAYPRITPDSHFPLLFTHGSCQANFSPTRDYASSTKTLWVWLEFLR